MIRVVKDIDEDILQTASGAGTKNGTGGMITKLSAASIGDKRRNTYLYQ